MLNFPLFIDPSARLIVAQPTFREKIPILTRFINDAHILYVKFEGMVNSEAELFFQFGQALHSTLPHQTIDQLKTIILDECNQVSSAVLNDFLLDLLRQTDATLVLLAAQFIPSLVFERNDVAAVTQFLPLDEEVMYYDYTALHNQNVVEVRAFGRGQILQNGNPVKSWEGDLPRQLIFLLVDNGAMMLDAILRKLWPHLSDKDATNLFYVTKHKANQSLGLDFIRSHNAYYHIDPQADVRYDIAQYLNLFHSADSAKGHSELLLLQKANHLYRGHFLQPNRLHWVAKRRAELKLVQRDLLAKMARYFHSNADSKPAFGLYLQAYALDPKREDLALQIMQLYLEWGCPCDALKIYERICEVLTLELKLKPGRELNKVAALARKNCASVNS